MMTEMSEWALAARVTADDVPDRAVRDCSGRFANRPYRLMDRRLVVGRCEMGRFVR